MVSTVYLVVAILAQCFTVAQIPQRRTVARILSILYAVLKNQYRQLNDVMRF